MIRILLLLFIGALLTGCHDAKIGIPKPRMYPKVDYPDKNPVKFSESYCQLSFDYPDYFEVVQDQYFFEETVINPCWFDLSSSQINSQLHCSYISVNNRKHLDKLIGDSFKMASKHNDKANYRQELVVDNPENKVYGLIFELEGPVASPMQFYLTDSTNHFFRSSLYFKSKVNPDSIAPIYEFVKTDILDMIETFEWN